MIDRKKLRKKILLNLIGNAFVILPFGIGATLAFATWLLNPEPGLLFLFASGIVGILGPIGGLITKWATGFDKLSKQALRELQQDVQRGQEHQLDVLDKQLRTDGDDRTQKMLSDLRALHESFRAEVIENAWPSSVPANVAFELAYKVEQLFHESVNCLKETLKFIEKTRNAKTETVRKSILQQRERIITEVQKTIVHLSQTYGEMLTLGTNSDDTTLSKLRNELDEKIEFARKVDQSVREFESHDIHEQSEYDQYLEK